MSTNYIEFRIHLKENAPKQDVEEAADTLQDLIGDLLSDTNAPEIFTEDITYEIKQTKVDKDEY